MIMIVKTPESQMGSPAAAIYVNIYMRVYAYIYICIYICGYVCICIYTHMRGALSPPAVWPQGVLFL